MHRQQIKWKRVRIGVIIGLTCLLVILSLALAQGFELQTSTYKLENPECGHYVLIMEFHRAEDEEISSFILFQSDYVDTNVLGAKATDLESGDKIKTSITKDKQGYFNVMVGPTSGKVIRVELDIYEPRLFEIKNKRFSFNKEISGEQLVTVILPPGYGLLESTGIPELGNEGRVHVEFYLRGKKPFPVHVVAAKLE